MKKIIYRSILSVTALLTLGSCEDFLNTSSDSKMTPDLVYENADLTYRALLGAMSCLTGDYGYSQSLGIIYMCGTDIEIRSYQGESQLKDDNRSPAHYLATASNSRLEGTWGDLYQCIERASMVIEGIEGSSYADDETFRSMRAEAIAIRALCYMELGRHWGNVPFKLESTRPDLSNVYLPKTDRMDIFASLVGQLIDCAEDLPWKQDTPERPTRGFAHGLAARLALYRAGWDYTKDAQWAAPRADAADWYKIARDQSEIVIESGQYGLEATYLDYFYKQCQRQYSQQESLFEIGFLMGGNGSGEFGYTNGVRYRAATTKYGFTTQGQIETTPAYFYSFHPYDDRRDVTVVYYHYDNIADYDSANGVSAKLQSNIYNFAINKWSNKWAADDFHAASLSANTKIGTGINYPIMRYSDVLLMFAEAEYQLNGATTEAKDALWKVRSRAIPDLSRGDFDSYIAGDFMKAIENERMWEFGGEGMRKFDLIRWGKLVSAIEEMREVNSRIVDDWEYDFQFPTLKNGTLRVIPTSLFYKYDDNFEDYADINIDYQLGGAPSAEYINDTAWFYAKLQTSSSAETNRTTAHTYWNMANSGLVSTEGVPVADGRPFQPVPASVIADYNGLLEYDYGFNF